MCVCVCFRHIKIHPTGLTTKYLHTSVLSTKRGQFPWSPGNIPERGTYENGPRSVSRAITTSNSSKAKPIFWSPPLPSAHTHTHTHAMRGKHKNKTKIVHVNITGSRGYARPALYCTMKRREHYPSLFFQPCRLDHCVPTVARTNPSRDPTLTDSAFVTDVASQQHSFERNVQRGNVTTPTVACM